MMISIEEQNMVELSFDLDEDVVPYVFTKKIGADLIVMKDKKFVSLDIEIVSTMNIG